MASLTIEKRKLECNNTKVYQKEDTLKKTGITAGKADIYYYNRGVRNDASLVPPIRQTASIFKQPVTVVRSLYEGKTKSDFKNENSEKPKQIFWEKRLEGLRACNLDGFEFEPVYLPSGLAPVSPIHSEETILQSVATALHVSSQPIIGQKVNKSQILKNPSVFLDPDQPLIQQININEDDIKKQEEKVIMARKRLQEALIE